MHWNYRIIKHDLDPDPSNHWYGLHEVFYEESDIPSEPGTGTGTSIDPTTFVSDVDEGPDGIVGALEIALNTLRDPRWSAVLSETDLKHASDCEPSKV